MLNKSNKLCAIFNLKKNSILFAYAIDKCEFLQTLFKVSKSYLIGKNNMLSIKVIVTQYYIFRNTAKLQSRPTTFLFFMKDMAYQIVDPKFFNADYFKYCHNNR